MIVNIGKLTSGGEEKKVPNYYLALGDSITAGYGVGSRNFALLYYSYLLSFNPNLRYINYGINGFTTSGLTNLLSSNVNLMTLVTQAGVITLTIGSNDLLHAAVSILRGTRVNIFATLSNMEKNLDLIGSQIRYLNPRALVKVGTIYNPLPTGPYYQFSGEAQALIAQANKILVHWAKRYGFNVVPLDKAFQGRERLVIGSDHLHPNLLGHQIIATEFTRN
ncbi:MAG: SGNH/GDSL hydrolase family protein [Desulfitobacteriaceae bacterium]